MVIQRGELTAEAMAMAVVIAVMESTRWALYRRV